MAKFHKQKNTPIRPVSSIRGNSYYKLYKLLAQLFEKVPGAIIETSSLIARETLELKANEQIVSQNVKKLYTIVPVSEAIEVVLRCLYSSDTLPKIERSTLKLLLKPPITKMYFKMTVNVTVNRQLGNGSFPCSYLGQNLHENN